MAKTPRSALAFVTFVALASTSAQAQNWTRQYPTTSSDLLDVASDGAGTVIAVGNDGIVLRSTDAGLTWATHSAPTGRLAAVEFQGSVVLAGGDGLFRSVDGGRTYTIAHPVTGVQSIEAVGATNAWAVTSDGFVLRSTDAGASWSLTTLPAGWYFGAYSVSFESPTLGWIGGYNGQMVRTTDGGNTWELTPSPTSWTLFGVQRDPGPVKFLLEDSGVHRGNAGNWSYAIFPWVTNARDFDIQGSFGLAVGLSGRIMYSPNNGVNWLFVHDDGPNEHEGVVILDALTAVVVGEDGRILHTTNGGGAWTAQSSGVTVPLLSVHALTAMVAMAVGVNGTVLLTSNGGSSWLPTAPLALSTDPLNAVVATTRGLWIGGDADAGIWRLSSSTSGCVAETYCTGKVHSLGGVAQMAVFGAPSISLSFVGVGVMGAIPSTVGIGFRSGLGPASAPLWNGTLCVLAPLTRLPVMAFDGNGFGYYSIPMSAAMVGTSHWYQVIFRDVNATDGTGIGMTNGLRLTFCP